MGDREPDANHPQLAVRKLFQQRQAGIKFVVSQLKSLTFNVDRHDSPPLNSFVEVFPDDTFVDFRTATTKLLGRKPWLAIDHCVVIQSQFLSISD